MAGRTDEHDMRKHRAKILVGIVLAGYFFMVENPINNVDGLYFEGPPGGFLSPSECQQARTAVIAAQPTPVASPSPGATPAPALIVLPGCYIGGGGQ